MTYGNDKYSAQYLPVPALRARVHDQVLSCLDGALHDGTLNVDCVEKISEMVADRHEQEQQESLTNELIMVSSAGAIEKPKWGFSAQAYLDGMRQPRPRGHSFVFHNKQSLGSIVHKDQKDLDEEREEALHEAIAAGEVADDAFEEDRNPRYHLRENKKPVPCRKVHEDVKTLVAAGASTRRERAIARSTRRMLCIVGGTMLKQMLPHMCIDCRERVIQQHQRGVALVDGPREVDP